jgi:putative membrane protein
MRERQSRRAPFRSILRVLSIWATQTVFLIFLAWLIPGVHIDGVAAAIIAVAVIALINALLWPLLSYIMLPFMVLTLGLLALVLNALMIMLASALMESFQVDDFWAALGLAVGLTALSAILSSLVTIDDDTSWYRNTVRRRMKKRAEAVDTNVPGVLFLEIDGLAKPVLEKAIREGYAPNLAQWIESGSHTLVGWETDLSSQTSASQAGILQGNNHNIPSFRWYDRARKTIVASSNPREVARIEKEISDGNGLLADNGASRGNLFSGDAPNVMNTASTILDRSRFHTTDFYAFFLRPYNAAHTLLLTIWDIILEKWQFRKARRNNVYPISDKAKRGGKYPLLRAFSTILMRQLNLYTLVGDMYAGVPSAYATFVGYDEVAHHSGVESEDAFDALQKLDKQFGRLASAAKGAPRPYHLVVLSDHGQTEGATFKQRYNKTLEDLIRELAIEKIAVQGDVDVHEDWNQINVFLTETVNYDQQVVSKSLGRALKGRSEEGQVALGPEGVTETPIADTSASRSGAVAEEVADNIVVLASGNLGVVYSTRRDERVAFEELEARFPGLLDGLVQHEGVGFVMVRSQEHGSIVIGPRGRYFLEDNRVEGENPLVGFGPNAAAHLRRTDGFPDVPDLLLNSFINPENNEGAAFEELIGFHGGLGGYQTQPFLLYPSEFELGEEELVGAASVHRVLKGWLTQLQGDASDNGHEGGDNT